MTNLKASRLIKTLRIVLTLVLLTTVILIASACAHKDNFVLQEERAATCENKGYRYYECECGKHYSEEIPALGHKIKYEVEDGRHYQKCLNEGCIYQTVKTEHTYSVFIAEESRRPTCTADGLEVKACVCGEKQQTVLTAQHSLVYKQTATGHRAECTNCEYKAEEAEHSYSTLVQSQPSTCQSQGFETKSCVCGKQNTQMLPLSGHDYSKYVTDGSEYHWRLCTVCNQEMENSRLPHVTDGTVVKHTPADCQHYAVWTYHCIECNQDIDYPDEVSGYGKHDNKEFDAKDPTETADGNIRYFQCQVCNRYFTSKEGTELTWEEIVIPRTLTFVEDYRQLLEIGNKTPDGEYAYGKYQFTFEVFAVENGCLSYCYEDAAGEDILEFYVDNADVDVSMEGCIATVNLRIYKNGDNVVYYAELINVEYKDPVVKDKFSLRFSAVLENNVNQVGLIKAVVNSVDQYDNDYYYDNKFFPNVLNKNDVIHFELEVYGNQLLKSLVINGKSYTLTNGRTEDIEVTEDIVAEFTYSSQYVLQLTKINKIDTSQWNAPVQVVNPYLSYEYDYSGSPNDDGRLYKGSITRFYLDNAYITKVSIEYEDYQLTEVVKNTVKVGKKKDGYLETSKQSIDAENKAEFNFAKSQEYAYFEYNADNSQARIVSITIYYETYNTFANK